MGHSQQQNQNPTPWCKLDSDSFVGKIIDECKVGFNLVPFIGSGMSAPSGILMGQQFTNFLSFVVVKVLGLLKEDASKKGNAPYWDVRSQGWPSPTEAEIKETKEIIANKYDELCKQCHWEPINNGLQAPIEGFKPYATNPIVSHDGSHFLSRPLIPEILWIAEDVRNEQRRQRETLRILGKYAEMLEFSHTPAYSPTSVERIIEYGFRSLHDWRATLHFLSRAVVKDDGLRLQESDIAIIDSFNAHIIARKRPNFGHTLLAHLAEPLRFRIILTTNFDTLLEEAFRVARKQLQVFEVSIKGHLPSYQILVAQNSLLKLHGGLLETRADLTLDEVPCEADCSTFRQIFSGGSDRSGSEAFLPSHLLVLGYSANDLRCVRLIKSVLDYNHNVHVFWVCYNENDSDTIHALFKEDDYTGRLFFCVTRRPDLLLYELYQKLTLCLPGGGVSYHYAHRVPPDFPLDSFNKQWATAEYLKKYRNQAMKTLEGGAKTSQTPSVKDFQPVKTLKGWFELEGTSGVAAHAKVLFEHLRTTGDQCVWLELQDFTDAYSVVLEFLRTIALRRGVFQLEHLIYLLPLAKNDEKGLSKYQVETHLMQVCSRLHITQKQWWLFLYGRNKPGACSGWKSGDNHSWSGKENQLEDYLEILTSNLEFGVVYMPLSPRRETDIAKRLELSEMLIKQLRSLILDEAIEQQTEDKFPTLFSEGLRLIKDYVIKFFSEIRNEIGEKQPARDHLHFLYALTLFRQSRHASCLSMEAVSQYPHRYNLDGHDIDILRTRNINNLLKDLISKGILWRKQGGTLWMYRDMRLGLRDFLEKIENIYVEKLNKLASDDIKNQNVSRLPRLHLRSGRARMHYWIGEWYQQAFYATGNHIPLVEAIYHYMESACYTVDAKQPRNDNARKCKAYQFRRFVIAISSIIKLLVLARPWLKFWMQTHHDAPNIVKRALQEDNLVENLKKHFDEVFDVTQQQVDNQPQRRSVHLDQVRLEDFDDLLLLLQNELQSVKSALDAETGSDSTRHAYPNVPFSRHQIRRSDEHPVDWPSVGINQLASDEEWSNTFNEHVKRPPYSFEFIQNLTDWIQGDGSPDELDEQSKEKMETLLDSPSNSGLNPVETYQLAELLGEFCYLIARRVRLVEQCQQKLFLQPQPEKRQDSVDNKKLDRYRVALCSSAVATLKLCNRFHPSFLERELNLRIKVLDLYGLALAQLGRFYEAHRRFDLVLGILSKMTMADQTSVRLRTELRKAEAHLLEAKLLRRILSNDDAGNYEAQLFGRRNVESAIKEQIDSTKDAAQEEQAFRKKALLRLHVAKLDDAWVCLENALAMLSGRNHSSLWWGRHVTLQLQCYAELYPLSIAGETKRMKTWRSLPCRRGIDYKAEVRKLLQHGGLISPTNLFRQLRFLENALDAARAVDNFLQPDSNERTFQDYMEEECFKKHFINIKPYFDQFTAPALIEYRNVFVGPLPQATATINPLV